MNGKRLPLAKPMGPSLRGREVSLIKGAGNRLLLKKLEKEVYKEMEQVTARLNQLSKRIRTRVTRMNKVPKVLDAIETVNNEVVKSLVSVGKW